MSLSAKEMSVLFLEEYRKINPSIEHNTRTNGNVSIAYSSKKGDTFAYLDFVKGSLMARLRLNPQDEELEKFKGIWRNCTKGDISKTWTVGDTTEILINNEKNIQIYIEIFELALKSNKK